MLSYSIRFSAPSLWMGCGPDSRCVGRVYAPDGAVRRRTGTVHTTYAAAVRTTTHLQIGCRKPCCNLPSSAPDDGRMRPKHVELRKLQ
jgi:hypothetical protein